MFHHQLPQQYAVIIPWLGFSLFGWLHIICFNSLSLLAMFCHLRAMTTDPGAVPKDALPTLDDDMEHDYEASEDRYSDISVIAVWKPQLSCRPIEAQFTCAKYFDSHLLFHRVNRFRKYCKRCKSFKPIRAHHCSICGRCIIKVSNLLLMYLLFVSCYPLLYFACPRQAILHNKYLFDS